MSQNLYIPTFNIKDSSVKDCIISILGNNWPLNVKKIHNLIKKNFAKNCTYQAVYKSLNELAKENILIKTKEGYHINLDWIKKLQAYTDTIETNYYTKERIISLEGVQEIKGDDDLQVLTFSNYFDAEKYLYYFIKHNIL